jgi:hypothetical protein
MTSKGRIIFTLALAAAMALVTITFSAIPAGAQTGGTQPAGAQASSVRQVGTVKTVTGTGITLTTDTGNEINVQVSSATRILQTQPGQKDLTGAATITLSEIQVGDRLLVRGKPADAGAVAANTIVAIKSSDIARKQEQERQDWQKHGTGGLVRAVDPASGTVTISTAAVSAGKTIAIHLAKNAVVRRYAADSIKFDDAQISSLDQIKPGDQLRARGNRSADSDEFTAEEIVSGTFRNIAGTVISVDVANSTLKLTDLATKKPVVVKVTAESQFHKLPPMIAQGIAMRLKRTPAPGAPGGASAEGHSKPAGTQGEMPAGPSGPRHAGSPDVQQMLSRMPVATLADLHKDDALMMVTTMGSAAVEPTAVMLLSGVEPILTASPNGNRAAMLLSPWNLASAGGEGEAQ